MPKLKEPESQIKILCKCMKIYCKLNFCFKRKEKLQNNKSVSGKMPKENWNKNYKNK